MATDLIDNNLQNNNTITTIAIIYTTVAKKADATDMAKKVITAKLAACVNIIPKVISIHLWQGELKKDKECVVVFKTTPDKQEELMNWISHNHPYEVPAIMVGSVNANDAFLQHLRQV